MICIGDVHRDFNFIIESIEKYGFNHEKLIQVGDFGLGFPYEIITNFGKKIIDKEQAFKYDLENLQRLDKSLIENRNELYVIRGNHDNPYFWIKGTKENNKLQKELKNIFFIEDYTLTKINDKNIFFIGGGISIDRSNRKKDKNYWEDEKINYNFDEKISTLTNVIDIVISHVPPGNIFDYILNPQTVINWSKKDNKLIKDIEEEKHQLDILKEKLIDNNNITHWISGHLHVSERTVLNDTLFVSLDINELYPLNNK